MTNTKEYSKAYFQKRYYSDPSFKASLTEYRSRIKRARKIKAVEYKGGLCEKCGGKFAPYVYDFHHTDPSTKDSNPSDVFNYTWERVIEELDKCQLLCSNCHRVVHFEIYSKKEKIMDDVNVNEVVAEDAAAAGAALNKLADDLKSKEATGETPVTASEG